MLDENREMRRRKKDLAMQPSIHIERLLKEEEAEQEAVQNLKTYKGFCVRRHNSRHIHTTMEEEEDRIASHKPMVLEFISIVCEHIPLPIEAAAERYDFSSVSGVEIPPAIELPKSMTIQRVRIPHSTSQQQDIENVGRRIQIAVADLDVHEIQAGRDALSQLLPVGGWHSVKSRLKRINFEKDCIYEEYSPQPCCMPSCPICMVIVAKKGKEKRLEHEIEKHVRKRESLQVRTS
jgi:hypothetical protein